MKKLSFLKCFVETLPVASESLVKTLRATSLLGMMLLAPMGASAQVTIGSDALPQATLDIIGDTLTAHGEAFRLIDGNQAPGKVLTCQENGVGTWEYPVYEIRGVRGEAIDFPLRNDLSGFMKQSGAYITLPPGKWEVRAEELLLIRDIPPLKSLTANDFAWVRSTFSDSPTAEGNFDDIKTQDFVDATEISGRVCGPMATSSAPTIYGTMAGSLVIENKTNAPKTYYYVVGWITSGSDFTEDEAIVSVRTGSGASSITAAPIR